jgi:hypothetical protein
MLFVLFWLLPLIHGPALPFKFHKVKVFPLFVVSKSQPQQPHPQSHPQPLKQTSLHLNFILFIGHKQEVKQRRCRTPT